MLKSDNWIRQMCQQPNFIYHKANGLAELISKPFSRHQQRVFDATIARDMLRKCTVMQVAQGNTAEEKDLFDPLVEKIVEIHPLETWKPMIEPFIPESIKQLNSTLVGHQQNRCSSFGVSSYGYDARLSEEQLRIFTNLNSSLIDPYEVDEACYVDADIKIDEKGRKYAILPPNSFMLGHTVEYFRIPDDVLVICVGKSTLARAGQTVIVTPLEPGWEGQVVIEIANQTNLPMKVYVEAGICQFVFFQSDERCAVSYGDRAGKYQGQKGITMGKV